MPIQPQNKSRYPADWKAIRAAILERANYRCEGSPAYPECRAVDGAPHPVTGSRVVLTIAHLDHTPETRDPALLRAWCQLCHNTYDAPMRAANRRARAVELLGSQCVNDHPELAGVTDAAWTDEEGRRHQGIPDFLAPVAARLLGKMREKREATP